MLRHMITSSSTDCLRHFQWTPRQMTGTGWKHSGAENGRKKKERVTDVTSRMSALRRSIPRLCFCLDRYAPSTPHTPLFIIISFSFFVSLSPCGIFHLCELWWRSSALPCPSATPSHSGVWSLVDKHRSDVREVKLGIRCGLADKPCSQSSAYAVANQTLA